MNISWVTHGDVGWMKPVIDHIESLGNKVSVNAVGDGPDIIFGASISAQNLIGQFHLNMPNVPMVNYNWDVYEWAFNDWPSNIFPYNLDQYSKLLQESAIVMCPSNSVVLRNKEFFQIPEDKSVIVKSFARQIGIDPATVRDDNFIYMPLRQIPDKNLGWFEKATTEMDIPTYISDKKLSEDDYKDKLASCTFIVCPWMEASTGGLSLIEGASAGKPVLFSNSPYMGANDYFGDKGFKFQWDSYPDFKASLGHLWNQRLKVEYGQEFFDYYKPERMAEDMIARFEEIL
mgnify:CR=1 FL=1|tara:strand:+ start:96855 stop:97718 length:864 start_codon:yes stop_codon:yes gene_type:complete